MACFFGGRVFFQFSLLNGKFSSFFFGGGAGGRVVVQKKTKYERNEKLL